MKKTLAALSLSTAILASTVSAQAVEYTEGKGWIISGVRIANPFDSATWWDGSEHPDNQEHNKGETVQINFADPTFWLKIPNPKVHSNLHGAFLNPVTWAQFFKAETYENLIDGDVWAKWLNADTYAVLKDPQTLVYWFQPGAYQHLVHGRHYRQLIDLKLYTKALDIALGNIEYSYADPKNDATAIPAPEKKAAPVVAPEGEENGVVKTDG